MTVSDLKQSFLDNLLSYDLFKVLADYQDYIECQVKLSLLCSDPEGWSMKSILNVEELVSSHQIARSGIIPRKSGRLYRGRITKADLLSISDS